MPSAIDTISARVETKYCERCGKLFLRPQGTKQAYCRSHSSMEQTAAPEPPAITRERLQRELREEFQRAGTSPRAVMLAEALGRFKPQSP